MTAGKMRTNGRSNGQIAAKVREPEMKAPDGGWGWMVILASSIVDLCTRTLDASFGLLFGDMLRSINVGTTGAALIVSTQDTMISLSGLFAGPLLRRFSYRKVTVFGVALVASGIISTVAATSVAHIIVTYSVMVGLGAGFASASTFVALSNYWVVRRGQANGLSMAGTGLGFMFFPLLIRLLLDELGFRGALLVLGGIVLHGLIGAMLLQPVKWHRIPADEPKEEKVPPIENTGESQQPLLKQPMIDVTLEGKSEISSGEKVIPNTEDAFPFKEPSLNSPLEMVTIITSPSSMSCANGRCISRTKLPRNMSSGSVVTEENGEKGRPSGRIAVHGPARVRKTSVISASSLYYSESLAELAAISAQDIRTAGGVTASAFSVHKSQKPTFWARIALFLELDILRDVHYGVVTFGLVLYWVAEVHFKLVVPFFLMDLGIEKADVAFCLSMAGVADILSRLVLPPLFDRVKCEKRTQFFVGCICLAISRSVFAQQTEWTPMLTAMIISGFCRGAVIINYRMTVAECVPLERLAGGLGLNMVTRGLAVVALGPALGFVRDVTGSFPLYIHAQTALMGLGLSSWVIEWIVIRFRTRHSKGHEAELSV